MTVIEGVDALGHPDPAALVAAGKHFVCQYLKNLTHADVVGYLAAGLDVVLIGESTGKRSLSGQAAGVADAQMYRQQADALGAPDSAAIYLAEIDFDAQSSQVPAIVAYYHGASSVLGPRCGAYGGLRAIRALLDAKAVAYGWQTYAWSGGKWDTRAVLQQYQNHAATIGGTVVDFDRAMTADYGAWSATPGDDMPLTDADIAKIVDAVWTDRFVHDGKNLGAIVEATYDMAKAAPAAPPLSPAQIAAIADAVSAAVTAAVADELAKLVLVPQTP